MTKRSQGGWRRLVKRFSPAAATEPQDAADLLEVEATRPCPHCRARISRGATVCMYCERDVVAVMTPDDFTQFLQLRTKSTDTHEAIETEP